jgi:hypothetical protein
MTSQAMPMPVPTATPESFRARCFLALLGASAVCGGFVAAIDRAGWLLLLVWMPFYLAWIVSDLRVRRVRGWRFWIQLAVSAFPFWGLLIYMVWTRGLVGVAQWIAFCAALWVPAVLVAGLVYGITQFASGGRW